MITKVKRNDIVYREVMNGDTKERYQVVFLGWIDEAQEQLPVWKKNADGTTATHAIIYDTRKLVITTVNKAELFREDN